MLSDSREVVSSHAHAPADGAGVEETEERAQRPAHSVIETALSNCSERSSAVLSSWTLRARR